MLNDKIHKRPEWDEYFLNLAHVVKSRSNCVRMDVGVVIVKDKRIIATGYNGTPMGVKNCSEGGCQRCADRHRGVLKEGERKDMCICIHAEQNALLQSAYHGVSTKGATLYTTVLPCSQCAKAIINGGIVSVVYGAGHTDTLGLELFISAKIQTRQYLSKK